MGKKFNDEVVLDTRTLTPPPLPEKRPILSAKKDFVICQNEFYREIKKGDDVSDIPPRFLPNLKTEGVL